MSEDLQEIERLIKQSAEFSDSLIRLACKLQEQNKRKTQLNRQQAEDLHALHTKLSDLRSHIDVVKRELLAHRYDHVYATPQKPPDEGLRGGVVDRTIPSEQAAQKVRDLDVRLEKEYADLLTNSANAYHLFEPSDPARARLDELVQQDGRYRTLDEYLSKQRTDSTIRSITSFMCAWNRRLLQRSTYDWQESSKQAICGRFANPNCANRTAELHEIGGKAWVSNRTWRERQ